MITSYWRAFQIGLIAGMRAMSAPALLSHKLVRTIPAKEPHTPLHYLAQPPASLALNVLAGAEMIADKIPHGPNRTSPPQFIIRIASGATCGAFVNQVEGQSVPLGAVAGGLGAVVSTLVFFQLRRWLDHDLGIPDAVGALAEDALVIGVGWSIVDGIQPELQSI